MIMIRINLLPREEKPSKEAMTWSRIFVWALIAAAVVVMVGVGIHVFRSFEIASLKSDIAETKRELAKYDEQVMLVRDLTAKRQAIERRIQVVEDLDRDRSLRVFILDELARSMPEYVWLETAEEKAGTVTLKGMAFSNLAISQLMDQLGEKAHVDSVFLKVIKKEELESQPVLNFEMGYKTPISQVSTATAAKPQAGKAQESKPRAGATSR
jgi:type IV pilus assembly protein PilN